MTLLSDIVRVNIKNQIHDSVCILTFDKVFAIVMTRTMLDMVSSPGSFSKVLIMNKIRNQGL